MIDLHPFVELHAGDGEPILVLPGGGVRDPEYLGDLRDWGIARPVAVVHLPGTPRTAGLPGPWWKQGAVLEDIRRSLGLDAIDVLAHSSGTRVALAYAATGAPVRRLGLVAPPATWLTGEDDDIATLAEPRLVEPAIRAALELPTPSLSDEKAFRHHQRLSRPLGYARWDGAQRTHARAGTTDMAALRSFFADPPPETLLTAIRDLTTPIHIIGGERDLLSGLRPVENLARGFRRGSLEMIPECGHYPWIDQPELFRRAVERWAHGL